MVVLRNALRGLAVTGAGPGQLLSWLNNVAHHLTEARHGHRGLRHLRPRGPGCCAGRAAGHLPPCCVRGGEAEACRPSRACSSGACRTWSYIEGRSSWNRTTPC